MFSITFKGTKEDWNGHQEMQTEVKRFLMWKRYKVRMAKLWEKEDKEWETLDKVR